MGQVLLSACICCFVSHTTCLESPLKCLCEWTNLNDASSHSNLKWQHPSLVDINLTCSVVFSWAHVLPDIIECPTLQPTTRRWSRCLGFCFCLSLLHGVSLMHLLSLKQDVLCYSVKATPSNVTHVWRPMRMTATDRVQPPALSTLMPAPPSQDPVSKHTPRKALTQVWYDLYRNFSLEVGLTLMTNSCGFNWWWGQKIVILLKSGLLGVSMCVKSKR